MTNNEKNSIFNRVFEFAQTRKKLEVGKSTFKDRVLENCIYVDKTRDIYNLIHSESNCFFSRPRRFGKSLLISTLKELFSGSKELFKDCWIYDKIEWKKYTIIHLDFLSLDYMTFGLEEALDHLLQDVADRFKLELKKKSIKEKFGELIESLAQGQKVVILIDEYDKPIIDYLDDIPEAEKNRKILKNFFSTLKLQNNHIQFLMITGVSKFTKVSIFSDLNHLKDISLNPRFSTILGYTKKEIEHYFSYYIDRWEKETGKKREILFEQLKDYYDGYSWDGKHFVYNPFSILNFFDTYTFSNYWFSTGSASFLANRLKRTNISVDQYEHFSVDSTFFEKFDIQSMDISVLLFQTGYLTIKAIEGENYILSYPNHEVRSALLRHLLEDYSVKPHHETIMLTSEIKNALNENKIATFVHQMKLLFSSIPYNIHIKNREAYYHSLIYIALKLSVNGIQCEVQTCKGRSDIVVSTSDFIYIIEFKMNSAQTAMNQIEDMEYYYPYLADKKDIVLMGIGLCESERNIGEWQVKRYSGGKIMETLEGNRIIKDVEQRRPAYPLKTKARNKKEEGRIEAVRKIAKQMLADNLPIELIIKYSGIPEDEIRIL